MSPVITVRLVSFFDEAMEPMESFCVREFENAVILEVGKRSAS
jgi:hypothetical protein